MTITKTKTKTFFTTKTITRATTDNPTEATISRVVITPVAILNTVVIQSIFVKKRK